MGFADIVTNEEYGERRNQMSIRVKTQPTEQEIAKEQEMVELKKRVLSLGAKMVYLKGFMVLTAEELEQEQKSGNDILVNNTVRRIIGELREEAQNLISEK